MSIPALQLHGIEKRFGAVHANKNIDLNVEPGTIHGIIGENGAGKSTLMSIIYGFYQADSGSINVFGNTLKMSNSQQAIAAGIGMVHQHFMLVENMSVLENILLGAENGMRLGAVKAQARAKLTELTTRFGFALDLDAKIQDLAVGQQQRVEIAKALYRDVKLLILDEPTGVLTPQETDQLFEILRTLRERGVTILLITHKLREIMAITDHVSVMRHGAMVAHRPTAQTNPQELAELMVGRPVLLAVDKTPADPGPARLRVENLQVLDARGVALLKNVSFSLHAGEILGVAGVSGNGQSELLEVLAGVRRASSGTLGLATTGAMQDYTPADYPDAHHLRRQAVAHVPEDRIGSGLVKAFSAKESAILGYTHEARFGHGPWLRPAAVQDYAQKLMGDYDVRPNDPKLKSANLSGGNQQKLILAREMSRTPQVLMIGQPTRGVDIGAIEMIYKALIEARDAGAAILVVSVELDEILALSDRIMVMCGGEAVGIIPREQANAARIGLMMANAEES